MVSLFPDIRIAIGYIAIILIPAIVTLLLIDTQMHFILASLVFIYFTTQIIIILNIYKQNIELEKQKQTIHKEQITLLQKEERLNYVFEQAPIAIFAYDENLNIIDCNHAFLKLFNLTENEIIGKSLTTLPDQRPLTILQEALTDGVQFYKGPYTSIKGSKLWLEATCFRIQNNNSNIVTGIGIIDNKTKENQAIDNLKYFATHDPLTSLLNRRGLKEYIGDFMHKEKHQSMYSLLIYLDLDKFKNINDTLGHKAGDRLLISISNRLKINLNKDCIISRFGGDEFIIVLPFIADSEEVSKKESQQCIVNIQKAFDTPFEIDEMQLSIKTSLGIVLIEPKSLNIDEIIRYADIAMYQSKQSTLKSISYYDTELDKERKKIFMLQHELSNASKNRDLEFYLQPLVSIADNKLYAAEALLRWKHPVLGLLYPNEFIPLAIETGSIYEITWMVLEEIAKYISSLKKDGLWKLEYISININAKQLLLNNFVDKFIGILNMYHLDSTDIMIEITERSLIDNFTDTKEVINTFCQNGIHCAIDDFGIGYSSLSYLKKLSFHTLKLDIEFIKDIESRPDDISLVKTILDIGKQFNYKIVIEGIENEKQKELLCKLDSDLIYQGFYFSKPIAHNMFSKKYLMD